MPRLDNSSESVILKFSLHFDPSDPGMTPPVDLCESCYECVYYDEEKIDHPPYEEQWPRYVCADCQSSLHEMDN